jgi:hypothetical protein
MNETEQQQQKSPSAADLQVGQHNTDYLAVPNSTAVTLKEEGVKIIYRNGEPVACFKQNGTLKMYKLVEVSYADIAEVFEPQMPIL